VIRASRFLTGLVTHSAAYDGVAISPPEEVHDDRLGRRAPDCCQSGIIHTGAAIHPWAILGRLDGLAYPARLCKLR
jgi:hypothetical protein